LFKKDADNNPLVKPFLKEQEKLQKQWLKELHIDQEEAQRIYRLLEWCDALSLLLCQHEVQPEERSVEVSQGPDGASYHLLSKDNQLTVNPWPFEDHSFELRLEKRIIPQLQFKTNEEFKAKFLAADVLETCWEMKR